MNLQETIRISITSDNIYYVNYDKRIAQNACPSDTVARGVIPSVCPILLTPTTNATPLSIEYYTVGIPE
ncbi:MAG: hypothetical protein JRF64_03675 [Deltaproteobacteria bacterium]|nr:hypothetical protein [Deltaproteobacteria bacterium]